MRNECPECQKPLGNICPSGLFLEGKEKEKALEYFGNHELSIWDSYANRVSFEQHFFFVEKIKKNFFLVSSSKIDIYRTSVVEIRCKNERKKNFILLFQKIFYKKRIQKNELTEDRYK